MYRHFEYNNVKLGILNALCTDVILGTDFQALHDSVIIKYGGEAIHYLLRLSQC